MKNIVFAVTEIYNPDSFRSEADRLAECVRLFGEDVKFKQEVSIGTIYFTNNNNEVIFLYQCRSGGWGNGPAPYGNYVIKELKSPADIKALGQQADAYSQFGFGWAAILTPQFSTTRSGLWLHCDGNIPGSLGCPVIKFKNNDDNIRCWNLIRDAFEIHGEIPFIIEQRLVDRRFA